MALTLSCFLKFAADIFGGLFRAGTKPLILVPIGTDLDQFLRTPSELPGTFAVDLR
jgi:hypothetical protein